MFCYYCGKKLREDAGFCTGCGKSVKAVEEPKPPKKTRTKKERVKKTPSEETPSVETASVETPSTAVYTKKRKKRLGPILGLVGGVVLIAVAVVLCFVFGVFSLGADRDDDYNVHVGKAGVHFSKVFGTAENWDFTDVIYEIDGEDYYSLDAEDFMDEPVTITVKYMDITNVCDQFTVTDFMIIDTEIDDSVDMGDYEMAKVLYVHDPSAQLDMGDIDSFSELEYLVLDECMGFNDIRGIEDLTKLTALDLGNMQNLENIDEIEELVNLELLFLSSLGIEEIDGVEALENLRYLELVILDIEDIDEVEELENLQGLRLVFLYNVDSIEAIEELTNLTQLSLLGIKIDDLGDLEDLENLVDLSVSMTELDDVDALESMEKLERL
ncbi:MAG: hypothetical protein HN948_06820, partial [Clostridia bacterium]|nr:hypothetical protein [Clostridia bacterium]